MINRKKTINYTKRVLIQIYCNKNKFTVKCIYKKLTEHVNVHTHIHYLLLKIFVLPIY